MMENRTGGGIERKRRREIGGGGWRGQLSLLFFFLSPCLTVSSLPPCLPVCVCAVSQDLARMLWLKSQSAEAWLDRRTNYSQSLSVMCMAGYILGLGDRHMRSVIACVVG